MPLIFNKLEQLHELRITAISWVRDKPKLGLIKVMNIDVEVPRRLKVSWFARIQACVNLNNSANTSHFLPAKYALK